MNKIFIILLLFFSFLNSLYAQSEIKVDVNPPSWTYHSTQEIYLYSNKKWGKIFYYTDGVGKMKDILQYTKPIVIKQSTTLNFFAADNMYEETLIQTAKFDISYPKWLQIRLSSDSIEIVNQNWDIIDLWYWIIETQNLHYEIKPYTYREHGSSFSLPYQLSDTDKVILLSPDRKVRIEKTYQTQPQIPVLPIQQTDESNITQKIENTWSWELNENIQPISEDQNQMTSEEVESKEQEDIIILDTSLDFGKYEDQTENFQITQHITTSVIESHNSEKNIWNLLWLVAWVIVWVIALNIGIISRNYLQNNKNQEAPKKDLKK